MKTFYEEQDKTRKENEKQDNENNKKKTQVEKAKEDYKTTITDATKLREIKLFGTILNYNEKYQGGVNNVPIPYGVGTLTNDDLYQGSFKNGTMELGQLTYKDGSVYRGFFKDGKPNGWGVLISSDGKSKSYSDSFEGKNPGAPELSLDEIPKGNEEKSLVEHTNVAESPKTDEKQKLFGKNIHLVLEIRANIENDVKTVVNRAIEETKKAEIKRVEDEENAKIFEKARLEKEKKGTDNSSGNNPDKSSGTTTNGSSGTTTNGSNSTDKSPATGPSFPKVALISAATAAATAGLYYAYKKYNKSEKKSSDKRSDKSSDKSSENMSSEKNQSENMSSAKRSEKKRSEKKRSEKKRSAKRSEKKRSEKKRSEKKRSERRRRSA
jgi:hypothetical protein